MYSIAAVLISSVILGCASLSPAEDVTNLKQRWATPAEKSGIIHAAGDDVAMVQTGPTFSPVYYLYNVRDGEFIGSFKCER